MDRKDCYSLLFDAIQCLGYKTTTEVFPGSGRANICPCRWLYRGVLCPILPVDFPDVNVKHLSQLGLLRKGVAYYVKSDIAAQGAPRAQEIVFRLGLQHQFRLIRHATMMPQAGMLERGYSKLDPVPLRLLACNHT